jgi:hypothetical protein
MKVKRLTLQSRDGSPMLRWKTHRALLEFCLWQREQQQVKEKQKPE